ncbi:tannase/feruloyl esterase family alpha/beta hydrolase [Burkholderia cenocepacia]|uniref:tannase/feruloyl esterase family alpha/beta hydrolase n=1 Tax=Burkholderia cenocepacia TaxID=95486 RepID=UPI00285CE99D|nr:tannase/feruloyl esterase family alpha/beta hydrolase [Burkholderia cenocepacia]MDR8071889.1 tannase/feruloyl esterase family alpha/beta hydrolase [Burkholderia cenocepacia]
MKDAQSDRRLCGRDRTVRSPWPLAIILPLSIAAMLSGCGGHVDNGNPSPAPITSAQVPCESLTGTTIANATIRTAQSIPAGTYTPPGTTTALTGLPAFCRLTVTMTPVPDSNIGVEVWLPQAGWNGRFLGTGNGGGAGTIRYNTGLVEGLKRGFAVANTDLGTSPDVNTAVGHPDRWVDFGYRANHEMTVAGKALVTAYYKTAAKTSIFAGCSTGGQQALSIAQRYPNDYNGILAGGPANNRTHLHTMFVWNYKALNAPGATLSQGKLDMVNANILASCAGKDGGVASDKFLTDPRQCKFNPDTLPKCSGGDSDSCLTPPQLEALKASYAGPTNPRTGERIFAGIPLGAESANLGLLLQESSANPPQQFYQFYWTFGPAFDYKTFDFDHNMDTMDALLAPIVNANSADLGIFKANGGKLILYSGSSDPAVPFQGALDYYERLVQQQGGDIGTMQNFARFYLVPGMGHCAQFGGGNGVGNFGQPYSSWVPPDKTHDMLLQMIDWVENNKAPNQITAARLAPDGQTVVAERPLCPYPQMPNYQGGDPTKAASFACVEAPRGLVDVPASRYLN